ncbi:MAG: DRTGG domain-containing protein [Anaerolineales bacterium]
MIVQDIVAPLGLRIAAGEGHLDRQIEGGYAADLLSCVMSGATKGDVWVTLQAHPNVIAVAELLGLACVVITEGTEPDGGTVAKANEHGIPVLLSAATTFKVVSQLVKLGIEAHK